MLKYNISDSGSINDIIFDNSTSNNLSYVNRIKINGVNAVIKKNGEYVVNGGDRMDRGSGIDNKNNKKLISDLDYENHRIYLEKKERELNNKKKKQIVKQEKPEKPEQVKQEDNLIISSDIKLDDFYKKTSMKKKTKISYGTEGVKKTDDINKICDIIMDDNYSYVNNIGVTSSENNNNKRKNRKLTSVSKFNNMLDDLLNKEEVIYDKQKDKKIINTPVLDINSMNNIKPNRKRKENQTMM